MTTQFAAGRSTLPSLAVYNTGAGAVMGGGATYYFWLQARNRCGYNASSLPFILTVPDSCELGVVIPGVSYQPAEDWHEFLVYSNVVDNFATAYIVGSYAALQSDQTTRTALGSNTPLISDPKQLIITTTAQLYTASTVVANPAALPSVPLNGSRRFVGSLSQVFRYNAGNTTTANATTVLTATAGRWLASGSSSLTENPSDLSTAENGCNQNINLIADNPDLLLAPYDITGGSGIPVRYYIKSASNTAVPRGTRITLSVRVDDIDVTGDFSGLLDVVVFGKVSTITYALSAVGFNTAGSVVPYDHFTQNILLEQPLAADEVLLVSIAPRFSATDLDTNITPTVGLSVYPYFNQNTSAYSDSNLTVGDIVFAEASKRLCVPSGLTDIRVLTGSGCVNLYTWRLVDEDVLSGFAGSTASQPIVITRTGDVLRSAVTPTRLLRALVDTTPGYSTPCAFSAPTTIAAGAVVSYNITIQRAGGFNTISALCSDTLIRGLGGVALLSTNQVAIIVRVGLIYRQFVVTIDPSLESVSGSITDWSAGTVVTLPTIEGYDKNLFAPQTASITGTTAGTTGIPAGACAVAFAYVYDGSRVSGISHAVADGCIGTESLSAVDTRIRSQFWADDIGTLAALKALVYPARSHNQVRRCNATQFAYTYLSSDTRVADDLNVIAPTDNIGRWVHEFFQVDRNQEFTAAQYVKRNVVPFGSTVTCNLLAGNQDLTLTGNTTVDFSGIQDGGCWVLFVIQGGTGGYTVTWTGVDWGGYGVPVLSSIVGRFDIITIISRGNKLYGLKAPGFTV